MKELGIGNEIAANENSINSLSELVSYLEKKGFVLNYRVNEDRDIVDKTLKIWNNTCAVYLMIAKKQLMRCIIKRNIK